jgi:hypothetical protein
MTERSPLRRLTVVLLGSLLLAATASPSPKPAPLPSPSPSPPLPAFLSQAPSVVIYPFDVQGGVDPRIGMAIAQILSQQMIVAGQIAVLPVPQRITRPDFQNYARDHNADFYISGYVTPIGAVASVVEQVVSVESGVILFSQTAEVTSVADVASQGLQARAQILAFVGRNTQNIQSQTANTPAPTSSNGTQVKIGGLNSIVDSVFHHKGAASPSPTPVTKPARGVIVAPVSAAGAVGASDLTNATNELYFAANRHFNAQMTSLRSNVAQTADSICGSSRNNTIATGTLARPVKHGQQTLFTLQVYTCFGAVLATETGKGSSVKSAVDAAIAAYVADHPDNS